MEQRGRINVDMSGKLKDMALPGMRAQYDSMFYEMTQVNRAHTVMLYRCGVHDHATAAAILGAIDSTFSELKKEDLSVDNGEDFYMNVEHHMIARIGSVAGKMHTGRSRNDLFSCLHRMVCRRELLRLMGSVSELEEVLIDIAKKYRDVVMTGYTHMQPAQPTTVGHYMTSYLGMLGRDFDRLKEAYEAADLCALGGAAFAGTGFPIDREMTARLLGFSAVLENTWDSVTSRDHIMQAEAAIAIMQNSMSRVASDLISWCTDEFGFWELGGQVSGQSSIMPQKKNPSVLENIRAKASEGFSAMTSTMLSAKNTPLSFVLDTMGCINDLQKAVDSAMTDLEYMKEAFRFSSVHEERALRMAEKNFCTATALADHLVSAYGISFREAHHITGGMVGEAKEAGKDVNGMDAALLEKWAEKILGRRLGVSDEEVRGALLPVSNVLSKKCIGGPSPERVQEMIEHAEARLAEYRAFTEEKHRRIEDAYAALEAEAKEILGEGR